MGSEKLEVQVAKASRNLWRAVGMGMSDEGISIDTACSMYETFVRPIFEYAGEIGGEKRYVERGRGASEICW